MTFFSKWAPPCHFFAKTLTLNDTSSKGRTLGKSSQQRGREVDKCKSPLLPHQPTVLTSFLKWHWSNKNVNFTGKLVTNGMTAQYNAWCHNNGEHQTLKRGHENWNAKIIWKMRMELEGQWDLVEEEAVERFEEFLNQATRIIRGLKQSIKGKGLRLPQEMNCGLLTQADRVLDERCERADALIKSIDPRMQDLEYRVNREERTFRGKIRYFRHPSSASSFTRSDFCAGPYEDTHRRLTQPLTYCGTCSPFIAPPLASSVGFSFSLGEISLHVTAM